MMDLPFAGGRRLIIRLTPEGSAETAGPPPANKSGDSFETTVRRDLMRVHSKKLALGLIVLAVALLVGSLAYGVREGLPSVALDWLFGLQLLRAAVAFVVVAVLVMLILRGWGGLWPERILTTGVEFPAAEKDVERGLAESAKISLALLREIRTMKNTELRE
jgi:hypothetical protein